MPQFTKPERIITPRETDALARRVREFGPMTTRELTIFFAGIEDGMEIKADQCQPVISNLELMIGAQTVPVA
jgi:hypothetical protein